MSDWAPSLNIGELPVQAAALKIARATVDRRLAKHSRLIGSSTLSAGACLYYPACVTISPIACPI